MEFNVAVEKVVRCMGLKPLKEKQRSAGGFYFRS